MKILTTVVITILVLFLAGLIVMYSGAANVSVLKPSSGLTKRILFTTMKRSVESRAKGIQVPDLKNEATIRVGAEHYVEMCQRCHGAPGMEDSELARKGLIPDRLIFMKKTKLIIGMRRSNFGLSKMVL